MQARIGIHDGTFHCDEVLACVLLKMLPEYQDAEIVRTRDPKILDKCDIVVDVGGVYDHEARRYDHHQTSFSLTMGDITGGKIQSNTQLSSAGLVYWHYHRGIFKSLLPTGPEGKVYSNKQLQDAFEFLYRQFVREIDDIDNGGGQTTRIQTSISARAALLKPLWDDPDQDMDKAFLKAFDLVKNELLGYIPKLHSMLRAREALKETILDRFNYHPSGSVVWFEIGKWIDWKVNLFHALKDLGVEFRNILFIVDCDEDKVSLTCTKQCPPDKMFPTEWRGLMDGDLERASGIEGMKFVHKNGHLAVGKNKETTIKMIDRILYGLYQ